MTERRLSAEDYAYLLPDHWVAGNTTIWNVLHEEYVRRVVEIVAGSGARRVLEVGCGDGWNCAKLVEAGLDVVGIDWSKNGIEHASRLVPKGTFYCGDVTDPEFMSRFPERFDAVILVEVIEHIPPEDCVPLLQNISKLVKSGGLFVLTTPSVNFPNDNPAHYRHFTPELLCDLVGQAGDLMVSSIEGYGDIPRERLHWRLARFVKNRIYTVHPIYDWLTERYRRHCRQRPLDRCHGLILTLVRKTVT